jgi:hypothetical protein
MKSQSIIGSIIFVLVLLSIPRSGSSQQQAAYKVPDTYNFDYEVAQQANSANKNSGGAKAITYYYSLSGDYTAMKADEKNNVFIIFTKDGTTVIVDNQKKTITLLRMQNMMGDMSKLAAQYNKNNPSATPTTGKQDNSDFKFAKTGSTKQISGYTAEEYSYTDSKGEKGSVWYAKVDFNTSLFFMMSAGATPSGSAMNKYGTAASSPYPQLNDPHLLVVEAENSAHPGEGLTTQSITKKSLVVSTNGYHINDLSKMMGQ